MESQKGRAVRVAFIDYILDPARPGLTGLSDLVWDMAKPLARAGSEVHVFGPYTTLDVPAEGIYVHRFALPPIGYRNIIGHILIILRAGIEVRRHGSFDVIHSPEYMSSAILATFFRLGPVMFTEPGNIFERLENGNPYDPITTQVYELAARLAARNCAHCIVTSALMRLWWRRTGVPDCRMTYIPLGVDTTLFRRVDAAKDELGLPIRQTVVLWAARLSRESGLEVMLRAMAMPNVVPDNVMLHILGDGPDKKRLQLLSDQLGISAHVVWHGWVDFQQLPLYYSAADLFVFTGLSGGTPRVMLQAMACGAPVLASAIGGIVDHIREGQTGGLFAPANVHELATQMGEMVHDQPRARRLGQAGKQYVDQNLDWRMLAPRIRDVYALIGASPKS